MELPAFLKVDVQQPAPPAWLPPPLPQQPIPTPRTYPPLERPHRADTTPPQARPPAAEVKARTLAQFEAAFPRLMEQVYAGYTLHKAVQEYPIALDYGAFNRWVMKDPGRRATYEEAKEYRTEVWADRMVAHAEGVADANGEPVTIERSKFAFDTYKFLMGKQNRKGYGEVKTLEVEHRISIAQALEQSRQRVIEAQVIDVEALPDDQDELKQLVSGDEDEEDDDE